MWQGPSRKCSASYTEDLICATHWKRNKQKWKGHTKGKRKWYREEETDNVRTVDDVIKLFWRKSRFPEN